MFSATCDRYWYELCAHYHQLALYLFLASVRLKFLRFWGMWPLDSSQHIHMYFFLVPGLSTWEHLSFSRQPSHNLQQILILKSNLIFKWSAFKRFTNYWEIILLKENNVPQSHLNSCSFSNSNHFWGWIKLVLLHHWPKIVLTGTKREKRQCALWPCLTVSTIFLSPR